jgi:hypothetical protein
MPSLLGTTVAQNYGKMTPQQTYGTGINFTNFATRNVRFISIAVSGGTNDLTKGADGATGEFTDSLSLYAKAVRALQTTAEIYAVFNPSATAFVAIVADDTANDSNAGTNQPTGWGDTEAAVAAALNAGVTVTITTGTWSGNTIAFA